jgi:hypothetical protein
MSTRRQVRTICVGQPEMPLHATISLVPRRRSLASLSFHLGWKRTLRPWPVYVNQTTREGNDQKYYSRCPAKTIFFSDPIRSRERLLLVPFFFPRSLSLVKKVCLVSPCHGKRLSPGRKEASSLSPVTIPRPFLPFTRPLPLCPVGQPPRLYK